MRKPFRSHGFLGRSGPNHHRIVAFIPHPRYYMTPWGYYAETRYRWTQEQVDKTLHADTRWTRQFRARARKIANEWRRSQDAT